MLSGRPGASLYAVPGDHALTRSPDVVALAAVDWLAGVAGLTPGDPAAGSGGAAAGRPA